MGEPGCGIARRPIFGLIFGACGAFFGCKWCGLTRVKSNRPRGGNQPQRTWVLDGNNSENPLFLFSCKSGAFATTAVCSSKIHTCHVLNFKPGFVVVANAPLLHLFEKHPETGIHLGSKFEAPPPAPEDRRARGPPAALKHHDDRLGQAHCTTTTTARPSDKLTARQRK